MTQSSTQTEDLLWPPRLDIISVGISALSSFVAGIIGGIFMLVCVFLFLETAQKATPAIFPYMLALVALVGILITLFTQFYFARLIFPEKYTRQSQETIQTFGFNLILFILFTPMYVFAGGDRTTLLMWVFCIHALTATLGSVLIVELLAQYRYSILALYASFIGFFFASFVSIVLFSGTDISKKILFSLSSILLVSIFAQTLFRTFFEFLYYKFYSLTGMDLFGSSFAEIQAEETALIEQAEKNLTRFD